MSTTFPSQLVNYNAVKLSRQYIVFARQVFYGLAIPRERQSSTLNQVILKVGIILERQGLMIRLSNK